MLAGAGGALGATASSGADGAGGALACDGVARVRTDGACVGGGAGAAARFWMAGIAITISALAMLVCSGTSALRDGSCVGSSDVERLAASDVRGGPFGARGRRE